MNLLRKFGNWFNRQTTGDKIALSALLVTIISSIVIPIVLSIYSPDHKPTVVNQTNSPVVNQAPNSKSEITYNSTNVQNGVDPRDVETYLKKLTAGSKEAKYKQIDEFYNSKLIGSELKDTLYSVVDYMDQNVQSTQLEINNLKTQGNTQLATSLSKINQAYAQSDSASIVSLTDQQELNNTDNASLYINSADKLMTLLRYDDAEVYYKKAIALQEKAGLQTTPEYGDSLNSLAKLYRTQNKYAMAVTLEKQVIQIWGDALGTDSQDYANGLSELALTYNYQSKYELAEPLFEQALSIYKSRSGINSRKYAIGLNNLGLLYKNQGKYDLAESNYKNALAIYKNTEGVNSYVYAIAEYNLAKTYYDEGKSDLSETFYKDALRIIEPLLGANHPTTILILNSLSILQKAMGR